MPRESKAPDEIRTYALQPEGTQFEQLIASVRFEDVGKGRRGTVLTRIDETVGIPIVRNTTQYSAPAQRFWAVHEQLALQIQESASLPVGFNNALIETYTNAYATMGAHSDQALDLADESFIAVFSCYEHPALAEPSRKLVVESQESGSEPWEIPLTQGSVVVFSVAANRRLKHKIVLEKTFGTPENRWLGITFRTSKTLIQFRGGSAYFSDGESLTLADDEQRREFYKLRRRENDELDFAYPRITYTISASDLMPPESF